MLFDLDGARILRPQRQLAGGGEESLGVALPGVLRLPEARQQLAVLGREVVAGGAIAQRVQPPHGAVELFTAGLAFGLGGGRQIAVAGAAGIHQLQVGVFHVGQAAQFDLVELAVHVVDTGQPPHAEGADRAAQQRHHQERAGQAGADTQTRK